MRKPSGTGVEGVEEQEARDFFALLKEDDARGVRAALEREPKLALARVRGDTALIIAAHYGAVESLRALIPLSDLGARNAMGDTALMKAASADHKEAIMMLLPGSNPDVKNDQRHTALELAMLWGGIECAEALARASDSRDGRAERMARHFGALALADLIAARSKALDERDQIRAATKSASEPRKSAPRM